LVKTQSVSGEERALLAKILGAVQIQTFEHVEDLLSDAAARHILEFSDRLPLGSSVDARGAQHWQLPSLSKMLGAGPEVIALKKVTWTWMQQIARELGR
jgi:hypothetical protein